MSDDYDFDVEEKANYEAVLQEEEGANAQIEEVAFYEDGPNAADADDQDGEINPYDPPGRARRSDYACRRKGVARLIPVVMEPRCRQTSEWKGAISIACL